MNLNGLKIKGDIVTDLEHQVIYSTEASTYRERSVGEAYPRTAGTSLTGQVVVEGRIVDMLRYMHAILETNVEE
ncbi:hypothetical protein [Butyricimonas paravirosa]|uniref:hypothetical protein n=1 Tax=Butyricimonas paravirosa TaxID=1472417 RepID=UPI0022E70068|nr:hypothetical protein [Butyricimonas paravirosa]